ncbi:2523_t:CDS:2 [Acaulospora morrowiae]|uniref:2523_t:CDS:1 n=1 Tax=Acaulospora morrowiae TaxID=94023 RepID=A0A9N9B1V8_9GLOM|nr:2523_t:CDS:2 [Acaulospora morrowiae]
MCFTIFILLETIKDLRNDLFLARTGNTRKPSSVYKYVKEHGDVQTWKIEEDIGTEPLFGHRVFIQYPNAPIQGSSEITINQLFCKNVVNEIVKKLYLESQLLVLGDYGSRKGQVYADIIIGHANYHQELTNSPPDLSKGLGWKVENDLNNSTKVKEGKDDDGAPKVKFEESPNYEWSEHTASLITGLICCYYDDLIKSKTRASGEKNKSQNNDYTYILHHTLEPEECIVFLAQVHDYGIKDAVLKIEVCKNSEISQVYREISALRALSNLSCVPKILFEGHTEGGSLALLTGFAGQPLESWVSDNGNIDDHTLFQIILNLLSCLEKIHADYYTHGDVAMRNVIYRNGHFYLIDFGLATMLQLHPDQCQAIIQDYINLCQIIGVIKFGKKISLLELIDKLDGELKLFVTAIDNASKWKIFNEEKWLEKFSAEVKQLHEGSSPT